MSPFVPYVPLNVLQPALPPMATMPNATSSSVPGRMPFTVLGGVP